MGTINFMPAIARIYRPAGVLTFGIFLLTRYLPRLPTTFLTQVSAFWWHDRSAHACKLGHCPTDNVLMPTYFSSSMQPPRQPDRPT